MPLILSVCVLPLLGWLKLEMLWVCVVLTPLLYSRLEERMHAGFTHILPVSACGIQMYLLSGKEEKGGSEEGVER